MVSIVLALTTGLVVFAGATYIPCRSNCQGDKCNMIPKNECEFGESTICGELTCSKGPDEKCGGPFNVFGKCGGGMKCQCGICTGCSYSGKCAKFTNYLSCSFSSHH